MTDPGHPFLDGRGFEQLAAALQDSVRLGVEHDAEHRLAFDPAVFVYDLPREVTEVVRVTGTAAGRFVVFEPPRDYTTSLNRVVWSRSGSGEPSDAPRYPDARSTFQVDYRYREPPSGLTDFSPGSVVSTLLRAVGRELALLYRELDEVYRRAFLDTASGYALDSVVALLGVTRNPPQRASGVVRFSRRRPGARITVPRGTAVEDAAHRRLVTTSDAVLDVGDTHADATVEAVTAGPEGNVAAGAVVVMPTPPTGVEGLTNPLPISGGQEAEADDALRERARHWLERRGNATPGALQYAVLDVDGVEDVVVIDHEVDPDVPLGEVRVRYSTSAGSEARQGQIDVAVAQVVDATRAAGVRGVAERVRTVVVSGRFVLLPAPPLTAGAADAYVRSTTAALSSMAIGSALSLARLTALAYSTAGLSEVAEAQLTFRRQLPSEGFPSSGPVTAVTPVAAFEQVVAGQLSAVLVTALDAQSPAPRTVTVRLLAGTTPVAVTAWVAPLRVQVRARSLATPSLPPVVVADLPLDAVFTASDAATVVLTPQDLGRFDPGQHHPDVGVSVGLAGNEAVATATTTVRVV